MIIRFKQIAPNLYRGSAPSINDVIALKKELGINKIVSLDQKTGDRINRTCKLLNIEHVRLYIDGKKSSLIHFLNQNFQDLFFKDTPVFFHCHYGKDRTGLAAAIIACKFLGEKPDQAIHEAKKMGFGLGVAPKIVKLYEDIIKSCNSKDNNSADIVSNERQYKGDRYDSYLDEGRQGSFAPYLDPTRSFPEDKVYNSIDDQSPTRENYDAKIPALSKDDKMPEVGVFNNDAGMYGASPSVNVGGFFYE